MRHICMLMLLVLMSNLSAAENDPVDQEEILRQQEREAQANEDPSRAKRIKEKLARMDAERKKLEHELQAAQAEEERERQFKEMHRRATARIEQLNHEMADFEQLQDPKSAYGAGLKKHMHALLEYDKKILGVKNIKQLDKMLEFTLQRERLEQKWRLVTMFDLQWQDQLRILKLSVSGQPDSEGAYKRVVDQVALINKHNAQHFEDMQQLERERAVLRRRYDALRQSMAPKEKN